MDAAYVTKLNVVTVQFVLAGSPNHSQSILFHVITYFTIGVSKVGFWSVMIAARYVKGPWFQQLI
jgi:hypothetical protein